MRRLLSSIAAIAVTVTVSAQVSYLQMIEERNQNAPDYINPASLTPVAGTDQYMELDGKRVIFIGNSYVYHGRTVMNVSSSVMTQAARENDKGIFYQH